MTSTKINRASLHLGQLLSCVGTFALHVKASGCLNPNRHLSLDGFPPPACDVEADKPRECSSHMLSARSLERKPADKRLSKDLAHAQTPVT